MKDINTYENNKYKRNRGVCWLFHFVSQSFPLYWHHYVEILYSLKDGVIFEVDEEKYEVNNGDMIFVWPGELHSILHSPSDGDAIILQFDASVMTDRIDFQQYAHLFYNTRILRREDYPDLLQKLSVIFMELDNLGETQVPFFDMRSCVLLYQFFIELWEGLQASAQSNTVEDTFYKSRAAHYMPDICSYITNNCTKDLTLEAVAAKAGFSKCYFSRTFKAYTGQSFPDYLSRERLRIAETLLKDSDLSITDIFQQVGFNSISTFNRVFQKFKKVNPTSFRQMYRVRDVKLDCKE